MKPRMSYKGLRNYLINGTPLFNEDEDFMWKVGLILLYLCFFSGLLLILSVFVEPNGLYPFFYFLCMSGYGITGIYVRERCIKHLEKRIESGNLSQAERELLE